MYLSSTCILFSLNALVSYTIRTLPQSQYLPIPIMHVDFQLKICQKHCILTKSYAVSAVSIMVYAWCCNILRNQSSIHLLIVTQFEFKIKHSIDTLNLCYEVALVVFGTKLRIQNKAQCTSNSIPNIFCHR